MHGRFGTKNFATLNASAGYWNNFFLEESDTLRSLDQFQN